MPNQPTADEVADAIKNMNSRQRRQLMSRLMEDAGLIEDLSDIADLIRTRDEPTKPYEEFVEELRAQGRDVPKGD